MTMHDPLRASRWIDDDLRKEFGWVVTRDAGGLRAVHPDQPDRPLHAADTASLHTLLEAAELDRLQRRYLGIWRIWRSDGGSWIASRRINDGVEPTLIEPTLAKLAERMADPHPWGQRHVPAPRHPYRTETHDG